MPSSRLDALRRFPLGTRLARALARGPRLALEIGPRGARALLARRAPGDPLRVERALSADLRADGLLGPAEMAVRLRALLATLPAAAPAVLVLPPGRTHSQLLRLRAGESRSPADLAHAVGGRHADTSANVFDARALRPGPDRPNPVWVSVAREADVADLLARAGLPPERVERVVGADLALAAAFSTLPVRPPLAVLVELGAAEGILVVVEDDQPLFAADLDWGVDQFVDALASDLGLSSAEARAILAREGSDALNEATPRLAARLKGLRLAVESLLRDHARETGNAPETLLDAPRWLSGSGLAEGRAREPLAQALASAGRPASGWPAIPLGDDSPQQAPALDLNDGVLAYGAAALALGLGPVAPNLAPIATRAARRGELITGVLHAAALGLAALAFIAAAFAFQHRHARLRARETELAALRAARDSAPQLVAARAARDTAYQQALPALYLQKRTRDFLLGTRQLRARRAEGDFWFALVADTETYQNGSLPQGTPSAAPETQLLAGCLARPSGLVVELSFRPGATDPLARVDAILAELRAADTFANVDILPPRSRRPELADQSVFAASGAAYALQLDTAPFVGAPEPATPSSASSSGGLFAPVPAP